MEQPGHRKRKEASGKLEKPFNLIHTPINAHLIDKAETATPSPSSIIRAHPVSDISLKMETHFDPRKEFTSRHSECYQLAPRKQEEDSRATEAYREELSSKTMEELEQESEYVMAYFQECGNMPPQRTNTFPTSFKQDITNPPTSGLYRNLMASSAATLQETTGPATYQELIPRRGPLNTPCRPQGTPQKQLTQGNTYTKYSSTMMEE